MIYFACLCFLIIFVVMFTMLNTLIKQNKILKQENREQAEALRKYVAWHRTWQLASPVEAANLKPPLIRNKPYVKAEYAKPEIKFSDGHTFELIIGGAGGGKGGNYEKVVVDKDNYTDGIVYPQQYLDRELEWNKNLDDT